MTGYSALISLECSRTGERFAADRLRNLSPAGAPMLAVYDLDLDRAARTLRRDQMAERPRKIWRYHEVLPVPDPEAVISLGEGMTPLMPLRRLGMRLGLSRLYVKDEGQNPTGSFKARGMSAAGIVTLFDSWAGLTARRGRTGSRRHLDASLPPPDP